MCSISKQGFEVPKFLVNSNLIQKKDGEVSYSATVLANI